VQKTRLDKFDNSWYKPGRSAVVRLLWHFMNAVFINSALPGSSIKVAILKMFGASIGNGVVIKPYVSVKYPWRLKVGDHCWIGENAWIDNLADVTIGNNVCISQGALLLTGNHDYTKESFDLMVQPIILEDGVWVGAKSVVGPGTICRSQAILSIASAATGELEANGIYRGNPAVKLKERGIKSA
jgi:putative colanic acid biosynthesis acetyltransferase WcaF